MQITLTVAQFKELVTPVLPFAADQMLPAINGVRIESHGQWLLAMTTDRFRVGIQRAKKIVRDEKDSETWGEFRATFPLRTVKSILTTFKAARGLDPDLSLTISDDGNKVTVETVGALFSGFTEARMKYELEYAEFPDVVAIVRKALTNAETDAPTGSMGLSPTFIADFKHIGTFAAVSKGEGDRSPIVIDNHGDFIGLLMPKANHGAEQTHPWLDVLTASPAKSEEQAA